jgi:hypothetical protein
MPEAFRSFFSGASHIKLLEFNNHTANYGLDLKFSQALRFLLQSDLLDQWAGFEGVNTGLFLKYGVKMFS